jgi:hypothetical protein
MENVKIRKRVHARKSERAALESVWKLVEQFISPYRTTFFSEKSSESSQDWRLRELYDSTGIFAAQNLGASLDGSLTNPAIQWFHFMFRNPEAQKYLEVVKWLEECDRTTYNVLAASNFSLETNEIYLDLVHYGVGALAEEEETNAFNQFDGLDFSSIPLDEFYFDQDHRGRVINIYRSFYWTSEQILEKFGREGIPMKIYDEAISGSRSNNRHKLIYCVFKRRGRFFETVDTFSILPPESRPYGSKYFLEETLETLGKEGGYYEMPVFVPRWRKATGSIWGWSPSMTAIYDVLTLNQLVDLVFSAGEKAIDPAIMTTKRGVYGNINLEAAGVTVVSDMNAMKAFESNARFDVSGINKAELKDAIERAFFMDQLQLKESPAMTATEVHARIQLMQRLLGPTFGRLQSDYLDKMLNRTFKILYRAGKLPPVPKIVTEKGWDLDIQYLGPLAKAQRFDDAQAIERVTGNAMALRDLFPDIGDNLDGDTVIREIGEVIGAPARIWTGKDQMEGVRKQRQSEIAQRQQIEMAAQGGEAMKAMGEGGKALKEAQREAS